MFNRKRTVVFEIVLKKDKTESVRVMGVFKPKQFVEMGIAEILAKVNSNYTLFVNTTTKEIKKMGFQKLFERAEKERFDAAKDAVQSGELNVGK